MLTKKAVSSIFGSLMMAVAILGCSDDSRFVDDLKIDFNPLECAKRFKGEVKPGKEMAIAEMSPDDAIVLVNGYPLTKKAFDSALVLYAQKVSERKDVGDLVADKYVEQFRAGYVKRFIAQRLLVDEAFRLGVVTTNEVCQHVHDALLAAAEKSKKPMSKVGDELKDGKKTFYYELALSYVMDKFISKKIPPEVEVNKDFVKAVQDQVAVENEKASALNEQVRERLRSWRAQIISNKVDFAAVAKKYSQDENTAVTNAPGGYWGEFTESEMDDARVAAAVFALKENAISDVLEDENGFHLVKVLGVTPPEKDENDAVVKDEVRKLSHIYIEKAPLLIKESEPVLTADLKQQMQIRAVNEYVAGLMTNGVHKIVYPHGTNLGR